MNDTDIRLAAILKEAREMMNSHGLQNWRVGYDNAVQRFGQTRYHDKTITISRKLCAINAWKHIEDVILHEIAHALTPGKGHGYEWRKMALSIGCDGKRTYDGDAVVQPKMPWKGSCQTHGCGRVVTRARRPQKAIACGACCRKLNAGVYDSRYALVWERNN